MTNLSIILAAGDSIRISRHGAQTTMLLEDCQALQSAPTVGTAGACTQPRHTKLDASGTELPLTSRDHSFLIDRKAGLIIDVRALHRGNHESCTRFAAESKALDRTWRLGTVEELFLYVADRTKQDPAVDRDLFPRLGNDLLWTCTPDAKPSDPAAPVYAWGVNLSNGLAGVSNRNREGLALPVSPLAAPASQS